MALEIAGKRIGLPSLLIKAGMLLIKGSIEEKVRFNLEDLEMKEVARQLKTPVLILASKEDELINWHHSEQIYNEYLSKDKELLFIKGSHVSVREEEVTSKIITFMQKNLKVNEHRLRRNLSTVGDSKPSRNIASVKSTDNFGSESISPVKRSHRSITPTYVLSRQSVKDTDKDHLLRLEATNRFKVTRTIYEEEENLPVGRALDLDEHSHFNIISQKLFRMKPKTFISKRNTETNQPIPPESPRKGTKICMTNAGILKMKKKPNITPAHFENNKLCHAPYLTNPNLVRCADD